MTGLQILVNVLLAVIVFLVCQWALAYIPGFPGVLIFLISLVVAVVVFFDNTAARLGVR